MIKIENQLVLQLLKDKESLVNGGRALSKEIEEVEARIKELNDEERKITEGVNPEELIEQGEKIKDAINAQLVELEKIGKAIEEAKLSAIPEEMKKEHYALRDRKEKLEKKRNQIGLKIQKIKDKVIPKIRKEVIPQLETEYDDIEAVELRDGYAEVKTFNHIEEFKKTFKSRNAK